MHCVSSLLEEILHEQWNCERPGAEGSLILPVFGAYQLCLLFLLVRELERCCLPTGGSLPF